MKLLDLLEAFSEDEYVTISNGLTTIYQGSSYEASKKILKDQWLVLDFIISFDDESIYINVKSA